MKIALVVPHVFMQDIYLRQSIFAPGFLAKDLAEELSSLGHNVTLFSPGKVSLAKEVKNITANITLINKELRRNKLKLADLISSKPLTYITLARQLQSELIAKAYKMANDNLFDIVHIYITEEDLGYTFSELCSKPVIFTHHEPFNFLTRYKTSFGKYANRNWVSISYSQRKTAPKNFNWIANIYNGISSLPKDFSLQKRKHYFAYFGRIIANKGVHLAVKAVLEFNKNRKNKIPLVIAGKYYKDRYWEKKIKPNIDGKLIKYRGFINNEVKKAKFLSGAHALIVPSIWEEPFGMVIIEALRSKTPIIGLNSGAIKEILSPECSIVVDYKPADPEIKTVKALSKALKNVFSIKTEKCLSHFKSNFTIEKMALKYEKTYLKLLQSTKKHK